MSAALIFGGPSAGHIYAGETGHALAMSGLRVAGATAFIYGILSATVVADDICPQQGCSSSHQHEDQNAGVIATLGALTFVGATIYDIADAHNAARRYNDKATKKRSWQVVPSVVGAANGGVAPAVGFSGRW